MKSGIVVIATFLGAILFPPEVNSENILFFHPISTYSHRISVWPLVQKLHAKGHQITFISPYPCKTPLPNVTEIIPEPMSSFVMKYIHGDLDISKRVDGTMDKMQDNGPIVGTATCEMLFDSVDVQKWLQSKPHYDLVVIDWFFSECALGLAYKFKAKYMFYAAAVMIPGFYELFGIVPDTARIPEFEYNFSTEMTLYERIINTLQPLVWSYKTSGYLSAITETLRNKLDIPDMPHVRELAKNASLVLWSEDVIDGYPMAITPNFVRVAGMHCQEKPNPLTKDLSDFISKSSKGFIYISLGSGVNPNNLPSHFQDMFFNTLKSFPDVQFVWKWSGRTRYDSLPNVHIGEWFPQQDILAHPKLIAFVTQAGKPSVQESICHGAPLLAMPVFADQDVNAERIRDLGAAFILDFATLTEEKFIAAVDEMINNKSYKERMQEVSRLFHDRPMKAVDTALWWTEYVLRNKDMSHLKSMAINLPWWKRRHLDVWGVIATGTILLMSVVLAVVRLMIKVYVGSGKSKRD